MDSHHTENHCHQPQRKMDYLLTVTGIVILLTYLYYLFQVDFQLDYLDSFSVSIYNLINTMFWGVALGIVFIGLLGRIPREFVIAVLGRKRGLSGIMRATLGGLLLDLCSHGILMVGAKLYERGASLGQTMAFLISSPWNSISLTLILWAMVGFKWMITFLLVSMVIACISGLIFERLVIKQILPDNPNRIDLPDDYDLITETKSLFANASISFHVIGTILWNGLKDSRMVLRWIFFGVILAALIRTFISPDNFETYFGPTIAGLGLTLLVATILEVCSEGTLPVAADILTRANAPGNSFTFLMAGVSTDYTEIMILKEATASWKIPLFLPLVTLPQVIVFALILNSSYFI